MLLLLRTLEIDSLNLHNKIIEKLPPWTSQYLETGEFAQFTAAGGKKSDFNFFVNTIKTYTLDPN